MKIAPLKCSTCGAGLSILPGVDRFACSFCGTQQLIEHSAVGAALLGNDKAAAELALQRLTKEEATIRQRRADRQRHWQEVVADLEAFLQAHAERKHQNAFTSGAISFLFFPVMTWVVMHEVFPDAGGWGFLAGLGIAALVTHGVYRRSPTSEWRKEHARLEADLQLATEQMNSELCSIDTDVSNLEERIEVIRSIVDA